jgi:hypothetical protein
MSTTKIPDKIIKLLLIKSGGRCQYKGCNISLYQDLITKRFFNKAYLAHIVADSPGGPRGDVTRSTLLAKELSNIMLLCDTHHRLIDRIEVDEHSESLLLEMKKEQEERIERITAINPNSQSHIITYKANVGQHTPVLLYETLVEYLLPEHYPAQSNTIDLGLTDSPIRDKDEEFWITEVKVLNENFNQRLVNSIRQQNIKHISLFAFAPMPLLVKLGTLINDIQNVEIYQPIRNPKTWKLSNDSIDTTYKISKPKSINPLVALNISLSATINNERITKMLGDDCSIYTLTIDTPFNDYLQSKIQLQDFSIAMRHLFDEIKSNYTSKTELHIFPAMPIAIAIELGRIWMPKADMPLTIYDENKTFNGFNKTIEIC